MRDALMDWISIRTTPRIVVALFLLVGCGLTVAAGYILALYPNNSHKTPIYVVLLMGLGFMGSAVHMVRVNDLLRELRHIVHKDKTP